MLNKLHVGFIENKGQVLDQHHQLNRSVKYILPLRQGMNVVLKKNSFSYDTYTTTQDTITYLNQAFAKKSDLKARKTTYRFHRVDVEFDGANPSPLIVANGVSNNTTKYYN